MPKIKNSFKTQGKLKRLRYLNDSDQDDEEEDYSEYDMKNENYDNQKNSKKGGEHYNKRSPPYQNGKKKIKQNNYQSINDKDELDDIFSGFNSATKKESELAQVHKDNKTNSSQTFDVEYICGKQYSYDHQSDLYFVKWQNFTYEENTWEPLTNLMNVINLVNNFEVYQSRQLFWDQLQKCQPTNRVVINGYGKPKDKKKGQINNVKKDVYNSNKQNGHTSSTKLVNNSKHNNKLIQLSDSSSSPFIIQNLKKSSDNKNIRNNEVKVEKKEEDKSGKKSVNPNIKDDDDNANGRNGLFQNKKEEKVEEKYVQTLPQVIKDNLDAYGTFLKDTPLKIIKHKVAKSFFEHNPDSKLLYYKVEWMEKDGVKPLSTYYRYEQLLQEAPQILLQYYYNNSVLYDIKDDEKDKKEEN